MHLTASFVVSGENIRYSQRIKERNGAYNEKEEK